MTDFRALCAELVDDLELCDWPYKLKETIRADIDRARTALAEEPAVPQPQPPAEGEVAELVRRLKMLASWRVQSDSCKLMLRRAAELLERLSPPQPVPVSERLPGDQLCWWFEADEDCGYGNTWTLLRIRGSATGYTHWLPAHALPIPHQQENANDH